MKKVLNVKMIAIFLSLIILVSSSNVFAISVLDTNDVSNTMNDSLENEYEGAGTIPVDGNYINNNIENENNSSFISTGYNTNEENTNNNLTNNSVENKTDLPQAGLEENYIGVLLIICVASIIYTYKKMKDYKNI